jgi:hypothetical protein
VAASGDPGLRQRDVGFSQPPDAAANGPGHPSARTRPLPRTGDRSPRSDPSPSGTRGSRTAPRGRPRAPMLTAIPPTFSLIVSTSPVWTPALISIPSARTASTIASAHRTARAGPSNVAKNPSPAVSTSTPRNRTSNPRTTAWCRSIICRHAWSPYVAARSVAPTMSVNKIDASTRSNSMLISTGSLMQSTCRPRDECGTAAKRASAVSEHYRPDLQLCGGAGRT